MNAIVKHFFNSNFVRIKDCVEKGKDLALIIEVAKDIKSSDMTMLQGWILEELHGTKEHEFDLSGQQTLQSGITPMGERQKRILNEEVSAEIHINITDEEHNRLMADAKLIRETFMKNNPKTECMSTDLVYAFLLGTYIREENEGEYQQVVNKRMEYSSQGYER